MTTVLPTHKKRPRSSGPLKDDAITTTQEAMKELLVTRKVSPLSRQLVERTIDKCTEALKRKEKDEVFQQMKRQIIFEQAWLVDKVNSDEKFSEERKSLQQLLLKMFLFRYGDYLAIRCTTIRNTATEIGDKAANTFRGRFWTEIFADLKREEANFDAKEKECRPIREVLENVALQLKMTYQDVYSTIEEYCARNLNGHESKINEYIRNRAWDRLAESIERDIKDLPSLLPAEYTEKKDVFMEAVQTLKAQYFELIKPKFDDDKDGKIKSCVYILTPKIVEEEKQLEQEEIKEAERTKAAALRAEELEARKGKKLKVDMDLSKKMKALNDKIKEMSVQEGSLRLAKKKANLAHSKSVEDLRKLREEREELVDEAWKKMK
jgi:hypothetical protein